MTREELIRSLVNNLGFDEARASAIVASIPTSEYSQIASRVLTLKTEVRVQNLTQEAAQARLLSSNSDVARPPLEQERPAPGEARRQNRTPQFEDPEIERESQAAETAAALGATEEQIDQIGGADAYISSLIPPHIREMASSMGVNLSTASPEWDQLKDAFGVTQDQDLLDRLQVSDAPTLHTVEQALTPWGTQQAVAINLGPSFNGAKVYVSTEIYNDMRGRHSNSMPAIESVVRYSDLVDPSLYTNSNPGLSSLASMDRPDAQVLAAAAATHNIFAPRAPWQREDNMPLSIEDEARRVAHGEQQRIYAQDREVRMLSYEIGRNRERYQGNDVLAIIASHDQILADKVWNNPEGVSNDEARKLRLILADANIDADWIASTGNSIEQFSFLSQIADQGGAAAVAAAQGPVSVPAAETLDESVRSLWRAWFREDPNEGELAAFRNRVIGQFVAHHKETAPPNPFELARGEFATGVETREQPDPSAERLQFARENPLYDKLFSKKQAGLSEEEYVSQFISQGAQMLGPEASPDDAVQLGMETGDLNETSRSIFWDDDSKQNSTFMGRLARAANIVDQRT